MVLVIREVDHQTTEDDQLHQGLVPRVGMCPRRETTTGEEQEEGPAIARDRETEDLLREAEGEALQLLLRGGKGPERRTDREEGEAGAEPLRGESTETIGTTGTGGDHTAEVRVAAEEEAEAGAAVGAAAAVVGGADEEEPGGAAPTAAGVTVRVVVRTTDESVAPAARAVLVPRPTAVGLLRLCLAAGPPVKAGSRTRVPFSSCKYAIHVILIVSLSLQDIIALS